MKHLFLNITSILSVLLFVCVLTCLDNRPASAVITLEVTSEYGVPIPSGIQEYEFSDPITASVDAVVLVNVDVSIVCTGWTGTGSVPATGIENTLTFNIFINSTLTWNWEYEYSLQILNPADIGSANPTVGTYRFVHGTRVSGTIPNFVEGYVAGGFDGTGSAPQSSTAAFFDFVITQPSKVTWKWTPATETQSLYWGDPGVGLTIFGTVKYSNLIYDPLNGTPRTFFYEPVTKHLVMAYFNGVVWNNIIIDTGTDSGMYVKVLVSASGIYHVAYHDFANGALKYATSEDGFQWTISTVDPYNRSGVGLDIGLDSTGNPWIAYFAPGLSEMRITHRVAGTWMFPTVVARTVSGSTFIALDFNPLTGLPEIAFQNGLNMRGYYCKLDGLIWTMVQIPAQFDSFMYVDFAINAFGQPFFTYQELAQAGRKDLKLTYKSADNWYFIVLSVTGDTGYYNNIRFDSNFFPSVYSIDKAASKIRQYNWNGIKWVVRDIADNVAFQPIGMTRDFDNELTLYYYNADTMYTRKPATAPVNPGDDDDELVGSSGGCFIATVAFGSLAAADVARLTSLRDSSILSSSLGSDLVDSYYLLSPSVAQALRCSPAMVLSVRMLLD